MTPTQITIRALTAPDEPRWRELFDAYVRFYEREPNEAITRHMLDRANDPRTPVHAIVALDHAGLVIGIANYLTHESTTQLAPVCYLQDLFVDPAARGGEVGRQLIDWLIAEMKQEGWSRLYWNTKETNYRGRTLYDKFGQHTGFLKYAVANEGQTPGS
ncbi:MAG: GNAT family N-acetyltransferase [Gemmatimonadaceae bacterium]